MFNNNSPKENQYYKRYKTHLVQNSEQEACFKVAEDIHAMFVDLMVNTILYVGYLEKDVMNGAPAISLQNKVMKKMCSDVNPTYIILFSLLVNTLCCVTWNILNNLQSKMKRYTHFVYIQMNIYVEKPLFDRILL